MGQKTEHERDYVRALAVFYKDWQSVDHATRAKAYEQALAKVREQHPNDDEAAIFHALQLVAPFGVRELAFESGGKPPHSK